MQIQFEYTVADYREANRAHSAARGIRMQVWLWVVLVLVLLAAVVYSQRKSPSSSAIQKRTAIQAVVATTAPIAPPNLFDTLIPYLPWMFLVPFLFVVIRTRTATPRRKFIDVTPRLTPWASRMNWLMAIIVSAVFVVLLVQPNDSNTAEGNGGLFARLMPILPWIGLVIFFFFILRRAVGKAWKLQPALQRSKTFAYSPQQFSIADDLTAQAYRWPALVRCIEAPNLFSLYVSELSFHMVPKRAFPSPEAVDGFRRLIQEWADSQSLGFPVVPLSQPEANVTERPV
jgi:hypothetical protein